MPEPFRCVRHTPFSCATLSRLISVNGDQRWLNSVPPIVSHPSTGGDNNGSSTVAVAATSFVAAAATVPLSDPLSDAVCAVDCESPQPASVKAAVTENATTTVLVFFMSPLVMEALR